MKNHPQHVSTVCFQFGYPGFDVVSSLPSTIDGRVTSTLSPHGGYLLAKGAKVFGARAHFTVNGYPICAFAEFAKPEGAKTDPFPPSDPPEDPGKTWAILDVFYNSHPGGPDAHLEGPEGAFFVPPGCYINPRLCVDCSPEDISNLTIFVDIASLPHPNAEDFDYSGSGRLLDAVEGYLEAVR